MPKSHFYPQHSKATAPAHQHWLVTSGEDIVPLNSVIDYVRSYAQALENPLPSNNKEHARYWLDTTVFSAGFYALFSFFGYENCAISVGETGDGIEGGLERFVIDTDELNRQTGASWPAWDMWVQQLNDNVPQMKEYCASSGIVVMDWRAAIFQQGKMVRRNKGYRLRPLPSMQGDTLFDDFVRELVSHPAHLDAANLWARRISRSTFLDDLIRAGSIDSKGDLDQIEDVRKDKDAVSLFLGLQPGSLQADRFHTKMWGFWILPLFKEAYRLRKDSSEIVQVPFFYSKPADCSPHSLVSSLSVSLETRKHRSKIGSLLDFRNTSYSFDTDANREKSPFEAALDKELEDQSVYLTKGRDIIFKIAEIIRTSVKNTSITESRPVVLPLDDGVMLSTNATRRLTTPSGDLYSSGSSTKRTELPTAAADQVEDREGGDVSVREIDLDLPGDDLMNISAGFKDDGESLEMDENPATRKERALSEWTREINDDITSIITYRSHELFTLFMAICLKMEISGKDALESQKYGKGKTWIGIGVKDEAKERLEASGASSLTDVRGFGGQMVLEGYQALGLLPKIYGQVIPKTITRDMQSNLAALIALMLISERPFLYTTSIDHVTDSMCLIASEQGCSPEVLGVLRSMGHYGNGIAISVIVGMRSSNPRNSTTARQWIRALLYPTAAILGLPFGTGPRAPCEACHGQHLKISDLEGLEGTSGLSGAIQSVRLKERLTVSVYATRRGVDSDHTHALGRTSYYDCLIALFNLCFRPEFVVVFLYFATLIHFEDKAARGKTNVVLTSRGFATSSR